MNGGSRLLAAMQCTMMSSDAMGKLTGDLVYVPSYSKLDEVKRKGRVGGEDSHKTSLEVRGVRMRVRDGDTSASNSDDGTSSPHQPSGIGQVQNGGVLSSLSSMWGSSALEHSEMAWREQEDKLGFRTRFFGENPVRAPLFIGVSFSNHAQLSH
jgi:hypothetical protein